MRKYSIKIYNTDMNELCRLQNAYEISYDLKLNELWTCEFKLPAEDPKSQYCKAYNFVELFDGDTRIELFRILPSVRTDSNTTYIQYECEHVLATLIDDVMFKYYQVGNLGYYTDMVIRYVLDKQSTKRWKLSTCDFKRQFEYKWENENLLAALFSIPKPFDEKYKWVTDTTSYPWSLSLKALDTKYKADILYRKNLQEIEKTIDPTNLVTRLYALGYGEGDNQLDITSINNNKPYLEKNVNKYGLKSSILVDRRFESAETLKEYTRSVLDGLCEPYISYKVKVVDRSVEDSKKYKKFWPGDYVLIKDKEDNTNLLMPIISVNKGNVMGQPYDVELEIANKSKNITGSISDLMERSRINETYSQGATNLMTTMFSDNADNKYPAKLKFFVPAEAVKINKVLLKYSFEPFRAYSKATKGGGEQEDTTESGGGDYTSTESGGGDYTSTDSGGGKYTSTHGMEQVDGSNVDYKVYSNQPNFEGHVTIYYVRSHEHNIEVSSHKHSVDIPNHKHRVNIPSHKHRFSLPDHTHDILYGLYEGQSAKEAYLIIDGQRVDNYDQEINIVPYLKTDNSGKIERNAWHEIEIVPDGLTRVNACVFVQLFTQSRGGGDY